MLQCQTINGGNMAEDKALWHEALAHYRAWNEKVHKPRAKGWRTIAGRKMARSSEPDGVLTAL
jgi:hypothetical protein